MGDDDDDAAWHVFDLEGYTYAVVRVAPSNELNVVSRLTSAELEVALWVAQGMSNRDVASRRRTSERTVANQLASIFRKLGVGSRAALAACLAHQLHASS